MLQNASHYASERAEVQRRTEKLVDVRQALVESTDKLSSAASFFANKPDYRFWLHKVAEITPDDVYLNRLSLEEDQLTVSGLAVNAANYQSLLSSSKLFSGLTAQSAFTRDARAGRERFSLTMSIDMEDPQ